MEFKRIDDTKFQCLLDAEDLEYNNISLDDFFRNDTQKIHSLLDVILEEAQKDIGVQLDSGVMSLQLAPQPNHSILLTISSGHDDFSDMIKQAGQRAAQLMSSLKEESNVIKREDADESIKAAPFKPVEQIKTKDKKEKAKGKKEQKTVMIYRFNSLDEAEEFAVHCPKTWGVCNSLYKDSTEGFIYMILERTRASEEKFSFICDLLTEYAVCLSAEKRMEAYVREHFSILIENNAVNIMKKYCGV